MSSRQINFFLDLNDQVNIDNIIRRVEGVVILQGKIASGQLVEQKSTQFHTIGRERLKLLITKREYVGQIQFGVNAKDGSDQIDTLRSPIIEYSRCYVEEKLIRRGRFYLVSSYWDEGEWQEATFWRYCTPGDDQRGDGSET